MKPQLRAILLCLAVLLVTALCFETQGRSVFRLHVIANSDSEEDQSAKLRVRDAILKKTGSAFRSIPDRREARALILREGGSILAAANTALRDAGMEYGAQLEMGEFAFPERQYGEEVYPAGEYPALRVVLGEGKGQNWWCVVFPPLCTDAITEPAEDAFYALTDDETGLITGENGGYVLRFRVVEWWNKLKNALL